MIKRSSNDTEYNRRSSGHGTTKLSPMPSKKCSINHGKHTGSFIDPNSTGTHS